MPPTLQDHFEHFTVEFCMTNGLLLREPAKLRIFQSRCVCVMQVGDVEVTVGLR